MTTFILIAVAACLVMFAWGLWLLATAPPPDVSDDDE